MPRFASTLSRCLQEKTALSPDRCFTGCFVFLPDCVLVSAASTPSAMPGCCGRRSPPRSSTRWGEPPGQARRLAPGRSAARRSSTRCCGCSLLAARSQPRPLLGHRAAGRSQPSATAARSRPTTQLLEWAHAAVFFQLGVTLATSAFTRGPSARVRLSPSAWMVSCEAVSP